MADTDTTRYVVITEQGELDAATNLPAQPQPLSFGDDNVLRIVNQADLGVIDPEFNGLASTHEWALREFRIELDQNGGAGARVDVVDNQGGIVLWNLGVFNGVTSMRYQGTRAMPHRSQIRIDADNVGVSYNAFIYICLLKVETTSDAIRATS